MLPSNEKMQSTMNDGPGRPPTPATPRLGVTVRVPSACRQAHCPTRERRLKAPQSGLK